MDFFPNFYSFQYFQKSSSKKLTYQRLLDGMQLLEYCELIPVMKNTLQEYKMQCLNAVEKISITKDLKLSSATKMLEEMNKSIHDLKSFQLKYFETVIHAKELVIFLKQTTDFKSQGLLLLTKLIFLQFKLLQDKSKKTNFPFK